MKVASSAGCRGSLWIVAPTVLFGCADLLGADFGDYQLERGDASAPGGTGAMGSGGISDPSGSGGSRGSGGRGGTSGAAGSMNIGGSIGSGGAPSSGGGTNTGGIVGEGGVFSSGGFAGNGGFVGAGGIISTGGASGTGGIISTGGAIGTGGIVSTGGAIGTGGIISTGGASGTGGASQICQPNAAVCNGDVATVCDASGLGYVAGGTDCSRVGDACLLGKCVGCQGGSGGLSVQQRIDAASSGATLFFRSDEPIAENVVISGKALTLVGNCTGNLTSWTSATKIRRAITLGASAYVTIRSFVFENCNGGTSASTDSGVILLSGYTNAVIDGNVFRNNNGYRGAVLTGDGAAASSSVTLQNNVIHDNQSDDGGVVYLASEQYTSILNNLVYSNSAVDYCSAFWLRNQLRTKLRFEKNVVWGNKSVRNAALEVYAGEGPIVNSSIVLGNSPSNMATQFGNTYTMTTGNPLFTSTSTGDFSLSSGSPAIDAGDPALLPDSDGTRTDQGNYVDKLPSTR